MHACLHIDLIVANCATPTSINCGPLNLLFSSHVVLNSRQCLSLCYRGTHARMSNRVLNHVALYHHVRLYWREGFREFSEAEFCIAIKIKAAHNGNELCLEGLMTYSLEEASDGGLVNNPVVLVVDCFESPANAELLVTLQILLQLFKAKFEVNFFGQQDGEFLFN